MNHKREDKIWEDLTRRNQKPFWLADPDEPLEIAQAKPSEGPRTAPMPAGAHRASRRRSRVPVAIVGLLVTTGAGAAWAGAQYATPPGGKPTASIFSTTTITASPTPQQKPVPTKTRWRTREVEVPGPIRWRTPQPSPGPTVWRTITLTPAPRPTKTVRVTVTRTKEVEVYAEPTDQANRSDNELPGR